MLTLNTDINSTKSAEAYVALCENDFEKSLADAVNSVFKHDIPKIITISGPTCSGKTTTSKKLTDVIEKIGYRARVLSIDDFYKDNIRLEKNPDFESLSAIDIDYLFECVNKLFFGEKVLLPTFDMKKGLRSGLTEYYPGVDDIYIFEGIQAVYPEITSELDKFEFKSIFISVSEDVNIDGVFFSKNDIRFIRRIVRDSKFRATSPEKTFDLWENVRKNEDANIFPYAENADIKVNSFLPYELLYIGRIIVPLIEPLMFSQYSEYTVKLSEKLKKISNPFITEKMIPCSSMFREFIG